MQFVRPTIKKKNPIYYSYVTQLTFNSASLMSASDREGWPMEGDMTVFMINLEFVYHT